MFIMQQDGTFIHILINFYNPLKNNVSCFLNNKYTHKIQIGHKLKLSFFIKKLV